MTLFEIAELLTKRVHYKPGWTFSAQSSSYSHMIQITLSCPAVEASWPGCLRTVTSVIAMRALDEETVIEYVFRMIQDVETQQSQFIFGVVPVGPVRPGDFVVKRLGESGVYKVAKAFSLNDEVFARSLTQGHGRTLKIRHLRRATEAEIANAIALRIAVKEE